MCLVGAKIRLIASLTIRFLVIRKMKYLTQKGMSALGVVFLVPCTYFAAATRSFQCARESLVRMPIALFLAISSATLMYLLFLVWPHLARDQSSQLAAKIFLALIFYELIQQSVLIRIVELRVTPVFDL